MARLAAQLFHGQAPPLDKARSPPPCMDTPQESAHPLPIVADPELRPAPAAAWKDGIAKPSMHVQRYTGPKQRRDHRNLLRRQFAGKRVLFANRGIRPPGRAIDFRHHRLALLDPEPA